MRLKGELVNATFLKRPNRFLALVKMDNNIILSFVPNPGRMHELLKPRIKVLLRKVNKKSRKTSFDLVGVFHGGQIVSVDSRIPNRLVSLALKNEGIPEFKGYTDIKPEYSFNHTRFDFFLTGNLKPCFLEVKSCTLVRDNRALFPDAVTKRGRRHVEHLIEAREEAYRSCILFIVQRNDASVFSPNDEVDPKFAAVLRRAAEKGVGVLAYYSEFDGCRIALRGRLRVEF